MQVLNISNSGLARGSMNALQGHVFLECRGQPSCSQRSLQGHPKAAGARQLQALDPVKGLLLFLIWLHLQRFVLCPRPADIHQQVRNALTQDHPTSP